MLGVGELPASGGWREVAGSVQEGDTSHNRLRYKVRAVRVCAHVCMYVCVYVCACVCTRSARACARPALHTHTHVVPSWPLQITNLGRGSGVFPDTGGDDLALRGRAKTFKISIAKAPPKSSKE